MYSKPQHARKKPGQKKQPCEICGNGSFTVGHPYNTHVASCKRERQMQQERLEMAADRPRKVPAPPAAAFPAAYRPWENLGRSHVPDDQDNMKAASPSQEPVAQAAAASSSIPSGTHSSSTPLPAPLPQAKIKTTWHPHARKRPRVETLEEYQQRLDNISTSIPGTNNQAGDDAREPWHPFPTYGDFRISEISLQNTLPKRVVSDLISLINDVQEGREKVTLKDFSALDKVWGEASHGQTSFNKSAFTEEYRGVQHEFTVWSRDIWDWGVDLAKSPELAPHWEWDACKMSRLDGDKEEGFVNEPWTGSAMYDIQSTLPDDGRSKCMGFKLYADTTQVSSFGKQRVHPVYARPANLPAHIRNGTGLGGGRVVGFVPLLDEPPDETGKPEFIDFKRRVYHRAWEKILESLKKRAQTGDTVRCGDGIVRVLYPRVVILSADYEEQCAMAGIIGGKNASKPCPICLVDNPNMVDFIAEPELRTEAESARIYHQAVAATTKTRRNEILKSSGLRYVENAFWGLTDPYCALCFDRLHNYPGGLAKHLFKEVVKEHLEAIDPPVEQRHIKGLIEQRAKDFPRWSRLIHFNHVLTDYAYQDSNKWEDMTRIILFLVHDIFNDSAFRQLLRCLRRFLNLNAFSSFENYTDSQLEDIQRELELFADDIKDYQSVNPHTKLWNFPKLHMHMHMIRDILAKGATRNYNTKPDESMHRCLKMFYQFLSNFRDIDSQFVVHEHRCYVTQHMRSLIDQKREKEDFETEVDGNEAGTEIKEGGKKGTQKAKGKRAKPVTTWGHVTFGASQKAVAWHSFSDTMVQDKIEYLHDLPNLSFSFRDTLARFLLTPSYAEDIEGLAPGFLTKMTSTTIIQEHRMLRVLYESKETWQWESNILRCSPSFYNNPRYDSVMIQVDDGHPLFARLLHLFTVANSHDPTSPRIPLALILPYDGHVTQQEVTHDSFLGFHRIRPQVKPIPEVVFARWIIRGALLIPSFGDDEDDISMTADHFVFDILDSDMFLRMRDIIPAGGGGA
ncbi:hypothetical protein FA13DRAFT_1822013 [Coprinellus micaceus]|uniref:Uncharacterized protein n=1 Tax=Coprinellus micaceus TaxID=71717 RepID=A0A4Y7SA60_COPMI|nr:hypothetical protein FA13DRAFT_1822013 [Coprinellus micaceus]